MNIYLDLPSNQPSTPAQTNSSLATTKDFIDAEKENN